MLAVMFTKICLGVIEMDAEFGGSSLMYHSSCLARATTFVSSYSKLGTRIGNGKSGFTFSPLLTRMNSSMVAQAMVLKESDGEVESDQDMDYPVPLSPFAGELSKEVEFQRALVAEAAMKAGPAIGRDNVLFDDDWLMIVNKPRGLYCEHVFATVPSLCSSSGSFLTLIVWFANHLLLFF
jgi:hypothetical protein